MFACDETFASLGVPAPLVSVLEDDGITTPFPIQAATLHDAFAGRDILGRAKTGSGKTLSFSLPMVTRLAGGVTAPRRPRGLVIVPTRELATQVQGVLQPLARAMGLRIATIYGGVAYRPQINALERRTDVLVACPGRLADLIGQGHCDLGDVEVTVIDEADQMADLGFLPIVRRLLEATPADGQRLLFSATLDSAIDVLARRFLTDPATHSVDENFSPTEIEHHVLTIDPAHRLDVLAALAGGSKRSLVFTRTKRGAERLARQLTEAGIPAAELHGNLAQGARSRNLAAFGTGAVRVMVATDIAARGIHVDGIDLVIHADPPNEHKAYVHRSGRTARGGADGVVVTMQTRAQARDVGKLMREAGVTPHQATAEPESEVVRSLAGPPTPRVRLTTKVTDLVKPDERLSDRAGTRVGDGGTGRGRKSRAERRGGSERPRSDRPRGERPRGERSRDERSRDERPRPEQAKREFRAERPANPERPRRFEQAPHAERSARAERPARAGGPAERTWSERPARFGRTEHANGSDRVRGDWAPYDRPRGQRGAGNPQSGGTYRGGSQSGGRGGTTVRSGYSGRRTVGGKRSDPGHASHS
jgi:superfamily II DNA/RNA helicase